jgi:PEGA domain/Curli production assembly/transport component CsgG
VAVMGFDNRSTKNLPSLGFVAQDITTSYVNTLPGVVLVTRDRLDKVRQELKLPDMLETGKGITNVGHLLQADALVTGSIVRYDVERRTVEGSGTSALQDVFRMALTLQILNVKTGRVQFSKNFEVERTKQYPKASSAPREAIDLTSELLEALLARAEPDIRSVLSQVVGGLGKAGRFIDVPVSSSPAGADVILDGIYMGKTPITLQLASDIHEIRIVLPGYQPWTRRFRTEVGKGIDATLVPESH